MRFISFIIKWILGFAGFVVALSLLAIGAVGAVFGVGVLIANDGRAANVLGQTWFQHDPFFFLFDSASIQLVQVVVERKLGVVWLWNPGITTLLNWPSWMALFTIAAVCLPLGFLAMWFAIRFPKLAKGNS